MLSPASHRVCCLAVMAPALTKADRRTDCLPVVPLETFIISEKVENNNRKHKNSELLASNKSPFNRFGNLLSKRKPFMHRVWLRTLNLKNHSEQGENSRLSTHDLRKSLLSSKVKLIATEHKGKSWHGTNATIAVADKVRLKYIMNKNNGSLHRNMGLARTNTTLGVHSIRKMNRFSHERDKISPSRLAQESGESSPDLPDSTKSELETVFPILRIVQPVSGQLSHNLTSASDDLYRCEAIKSDFLLTASKSDVLSSDIKSCDFDTFPAAASDSTNAVESHCDLPISSTEPQDVDSMFRMSPAVSQKLDLKSLEADVSSNCPTLPCSNAISTSETNLCVSLSQSASVLESFETSKQQNLTNFTSFSSLPSESCIDPSASLDCDTSLHVSVQSPDLFQPPLSPKHESDIETASANYSFSSSSTLSADDASPLGSPYQDSSDPVFVTFPDSFLASGSDIKPPTEISASQFASTSSLNHLSSIWDSSDQEDDLMIDQCCSVTKRDLSCLRKSFREIEGKMVKSLSEVEDIMNKCMLNHVQQEIVSLTQGFREKLLNSSEKHPKSCNYPKPFRDLVDLKSESVQSNDECNISSEFLTSLVRQLEQSSCSNLSKKMDIELQGNGDIALVTFSHKEYFDIKNTSQVLLKNVKALLQSSDPDLTESSDDEEKDKEDTEVNSNQQRAMLKFMKQRAALASRSTWLISRIHDLENQLRTIGGIYKKLTSSIGDVQFEEQVVSVDSLAKSKILPRPVNGYLDHSAEVERKRSKNEYGESCSRTRAFQNSAFKKRKILVTTGLHNVSAKLAKLSTVGCNCNSLDEAMPCVLCMGRYSCVQSVDPDSLPLLDRLSLLDSNFHPILSLEKDIPMLAHFENILKKNESHYQVTPQSPSLITNHRRLHLDSKSKHLVDVRSRSRKLNRYARSLLSAKYRNKKHFRKHSLLLKKWRRLQNKSSFHARDRFRRLSVVSSGSSRDSPALSPLSVWEDGSDLKRRRDDNQFDIDDVIIPYSSKRGRLVKFEFKDIEIPSWRSMAFGNLEYIDIEEDTSDAAFVHRHEGYEVEERKIIRNGGDALCFFQTWQKRARPDPVLLCGDFVVQSPLPSPAPSPPPSDDSQGPVRRKINPPFKRPSEECASVTTTAEVAPYETRCFPLSDDLLEELVAESELSPVEQEPLSCPLSPACGSTTCSTTSTVDEDDDVTDPEWTVVKKDCGADLVLKFAKR